MKILLVATWKAWTVPILIVLGIAGFLLRGFLDMAENFETGYGPASRKAGIQAFIILGGFISAAVVIGFFVSGCADIMGGIGGVSPDHDPDRDAFKHYEQKHGDNWLPKASIHDYYARQRAKGAKPIFDPWFENRSSRQMSLHYDEEGQ